MKKTLFIIAACALTAVSCQKETAVENGTSSEAVFTVTADIAQFDADTKTSINGAAATITPVWSADDSIKLFNTAGNAFVYVVKSDGAGKSKAVFEPKGDAFEGTFACAYYPADTTKYVPGTGIIAGIPATQVYAAPITAGVNAGTFANGSFPMVGTGTLDASKGNLDLTFKNVFGLVQLNFTGTETVKEITLKSEKSLSGTATIAVDENRSCTITNGEKYVTLTFATPVNLDSSTPTAFYIAVPADSTISRVYVTTGTSLLYKEKAITAKRSQIASLNSATLTSAGFTAVTYSEASTLTPLIIKGTVWAPVNCGYVPKTGDSGDALGYPYGKLYQWGRKNGQGFNSSDASYPSGEQIANTFSGTNGTENSAYFYKGNTSGSTTAVPYIYDWITNNGSNTFWNLNEGTANPVSKNTSFDPCPAGWRVPTKDELNALLGGAAKYLSGGLQTDTRTDSPTKDMSGLFFDGTTTLKPTSGVFLPAAGSRNATNGNSSNRGSVGGYWSSTVYDTGSNSLNLMSFCANMGTFGRASGLSVRCVQE